MRKKLLDYNAMRIIIKNGKEAWESTSRPYLRSMMTLKYSTDTIRKFGESITTTVLQTMSTFSIVSITT